MSASSISILKHVMEKYSQLKKKKDAVHIVKMLWHTKFKYGICKLVWAPDMRRSFLYLHMHELYPFFV